MSSSSNARRPRGGAPRAAPGRRGAPSWSSPLSRRGKQASLGRDPAARRTRPRAPSSRRVARARPHGPSFFERDPTPREEAPERPDPEPQPPLFLQLRLEFAERDVRGLLHFPADELRFVLDAIRPAIAALLLRSDRPRRALLHGPADRA